MNLNPTESSLLWSDNRFLSALDANIRDQIASSIALDKVDSTNRYIQKNVLFDAERWSVVTANEQNSGKGRRGNRWISPPGCNIYLSMGKLYNIPLEQLSTFSLLVGVSLLNGLQRFGIEGLQLKWPNDLYLKEKKVAGILIEINGQHDKGGLQLTLGFGVNVNMDSTDPDLIDPDWTDISRHFGAMRREDLAASIVSEILQQEELWQRLGAEPIIKQWKKYDLLLGKEIAIQQGSRELYGKGAGIDAEGRLLLQINAKIHPISSGHICRFS